MMSSGKMVRVVCSTSTAIACLLLSGCILIPKSFKYGAGDVSYAGAGQVFPEGFSRVDLFALLTDDASRDDVCGERPWINNVQDYEGRCIDLALMQFESTYPGELAVPRRNAIQERLLSASNQRCELFKQWLHSKRSFVGLTLGVLTTATGTAGAIVTSEEGSRILSGASALFSGSRAEYNQELFSNLTTSVIVQGIDLRRREIYEQIAKQGQSRPYSAYNVAAAIKDAIYYNGHCSVLSGIQVASDSIRSLEDPGLDTANRTLAKLLVTRALLDSGSQDLTVGNAIESLGQVASILYAGTPNGAQAQAPATAVGKTDDAKKAVVGMDTVFRRAATEATFAAGADNNRSTLITAASDAADKALNVINGCVDQAITLDKAAVTAIVAAKGAALIPDVTQTQLATSSNELREAEAAQAKLVGDLDGVVKSFNAVIADAIRALKDGDVDANRANTVSGSIAAFAPDAVCAADT